MSSAKVVLFFGAVTQTVAALGSSIPAEGGAVFDDVRMTCLCLIGSLMGAFLAISMFSPDGKTEAANVRQIAFKFFSSMVSGVAFTPMLLWGVLQATGVSFYQSDVLLGLSAIDATLAVYSIHKVIPWLEQRRHSSPSIIITNNIGDHAAIDTFQTGEHAKHERKTEH